jgi:DNA-directed RNA polymerase subunit RPC12/RpoP
MASLFLFPVVLWATILVFLKLSDSGTVNLLEILVVAALATFGILVFAMQMVALIFAKAMDAPCQQCGKSLRQLPPERRQKVARQLGSNDGDAHCPHCGVRLEVPTAS